VRLSNSITLELSSVSLELADPCNQNGQYRQYQASLSTKRQS